MNTYSCKDNPPCIVQCDSILEAHPDAFQFLIFPEGSWWEYELLDSGILDTLTLTRNFVSFTDNQCIDGEDVCKNNYYLIYRHSNILYAGESSDHRGSRETFFLKTFNGKSWVVLHSTFASNNASMGHFLDFPFNTGYKYGDDRFISDTAIDLEINNKKVKCLEITALKNNYLHDHRIMKIYLSRGVGIVRYEYQNGHIWQLKSHFINH